MKPAITDIPGIGPVAAEALAEHDLTTVYRLSKTTIEKLSTIPGFSEARATKVIAAAIELHGTYGKARQPESEEAQGGSEKKGKKDKGKKKEKAKDKKKGKDKDKGKGKGKGKCKAKEKRKGNNKIKGKLRQDVCPGERSAH